MANGIMTLRELIHSLEVLALSTPSDTVVYTTGRDGRDSVVAQVAYEPDETVHDEPGYVHLVPGVELV